MHQLASMFYLRWRQTGLLSDVERAIRFAEGAVAANVADEASSILYAHFLGILLERKFRDSQMIRDIDRAIEVTHMVADRLSKSPLPHPCHSECLFAHARQLTQKFILAGDPNVLDTAVSFATKAIDQAKDQRSHAICHYALSEALGERFKLAGEQSDLDCAVEAAKTAADGLRDVRFEIHLALLSKTRYLRTEISDDINRAVRASVDAVRLCSDETHRMMCMMMLSEMLQMKFESTHEIKHLHAAIDVSEKALAAAAPGSDDEAKIRSYLAFLLGLRYMKTECTDDINRAISLTEMVSEGPTSNPQERASRLGHLTGLLVLRNQRIGTVEDLNRAIEIGMGIKDIASASKPVLGQCLKPLAAALVTRYSTLGMKADLDFAIEILADALGKISSSDFVIRYEILRELSNFLSFRGEWTGTMDLDYAIKLAEEAVSVLPLSHRLRPSSLYSLSSIIARRFNVSRKVSDLDWAVKILDGLVAENQSDDVDGYLHLKNLGSFLFMRYSKSNVAKDLDLSLDAYKRALKIFPPDNMNLGLLSLQYGQALHERAILSGSCLDLEQAFLHLQEGFDSHLTSPSTRIALAQRAAVISWSGLISGLGWEHSARLLEQAIYLLPSLSPRSLKNVEKQRHLKPYQQLASQATESALQAGKGAYHALKLLELGRNVIASLLLETRTEVTELRQAHPDLAQKFSDLQHELDSPDKNADAVLGRKAVHSWVTWTRRRSNIEHEFKEVVDKIRGKSGFHDFLLPPTEEDMKTTAEIGPIVVINIAYFRSDAFLVTRNGIRVLSLPGASFSKVREKVRQMTLFLRSEATSFRIKYVLAWLWETIACPILDALGFTGPCCSDAWPTIWWITTGALCKLPLHAAGRIYPRSTETVYHRARSCYASSIKALIHARRRKTLASKDHEAEYALLLQMSETPESGPLPFASDEVAVLDGLLPSLGLKPLRPPPRKEDVLASLRRCKIFHFAGHGASDTLDPSRSCLLLEDWKSNPLTVEDVREIWIQESSPFLCYLSACSTGAIKSNTLFEEGIHLISSFQLAGFRHAIGTLWEVSDKYCVDVAKIFYETLKDKDLTDEAVSHGFHRAIMANLEADFATRAPYTNHPNEEKPVAIDRRMTRESEEDCSESIAQSLQKATDEMQSLHIASQATKSLRQKFLEHAAQMDMDIGHEERDVTLLVAGSKADKDNDLKWEPPLYWVPYLHYGV